MTTPFGDISYSTAGTAAEQQLVLYHEKVHQFFAPKLKLLRDFRVLKYEESYWKSHLLRYLEEALAETYAQLRVNGIKGLPDALVFPLRQPEYEIIVSRIIKEAALGTITVGGTAYAVYVVTDKLVSPPKLSKQPLKR